MPNWIQQPHAKRIEVNPSIKVREPSIWLWFQTEIERENWYWISSESFLLPDIFFFKHEEDKVKFILRWL